MSDPHAVDDIEIGEKVGYRVFSMVGYQLYGLSEQSYPLEPGGSQAVCTAGHSHTKVLRNTPEGGTELVDAPWHGPVPSPKCGCGYWAYKTEGGARYRLSNYMGRGRSPFGGGFAIASRSGFGDFGDGTFDEENGVIFAEVKLWGRVVQGKDGYRGEYCKVSALFETPGVSSEALAKCAEFYDVPVVQSTTEAEDPNEVKGEVEKVVAPRTSSRTGRTAPGSVVIGGKTYKVWTKTKNQKGTNPTWEALSSLAAYKGDEISKEVTVRTKTVYSNYGTDIFISGITKWHDPAAGGSEATG